MNLQEANLVLRKLPKGPVYNIRYIVRMRAVTKRSQGILAERRHHVPRLPRSLRAASPRRALQSPDLRFTDLGKPGHYLLFALLFLLFFVRNFVLQKQLFCEPVFVFKTFRGRFQNAQDKSAIANTELLQLFQVEENGFGTVAQIPRTACSSPFPDHKFWPSAVQFQVLLIVFEGKLIKQTQPMPKYISPTKSLSALKHLDIFIRIEMILSRLANQTIELTVMAPIAPVIR